MEILGIHTGFSPMSQQTLPHRDQNLKSKTPHTNVGNYERMASVAIGGYLVYRAIKNRRWSSLLLGSTGVSLLNRGMSGYCPVYSRAGLSSTT